MKKIIKISLISLLLLFTLGINFCGAEACDSKEDICYTPEVTFPGFEGVQKVTPMLLGKYISNLYQYLLYVAGVLAVIVIMVGGFQWITAGGNQSKIGEAKGRITSAIIGLFLALTSYLLLYTINPNLVEIVDLSMPSIMPIDSYCTEDQMVTFYYRNNPNISSTQGNRLNNAGGHFSAVSGDEAVCGLIYEYKIEGNKFECKGDVCSDDSKLCALDGECYAPLKALCIGKEKGASCGGPDDPWIVAHWSGDPFPYGYCNEAGDDGGECTPCFEVGDDCAFYDPPPYGCPNPKGKCGKGVGDYCDNVHTECTADLNGGGNTE